MQLDTRSDHFAYYAHFNLQVFGVKHAKDTSKNQFS